ncbi:hypothetical protein NW754_006540 [Fusarium falciforme]|nr:hypothetical protein NW754_006540 [Fusarium falciforme]
MKLTCCPGLVNDASKRPKLDSVRLRHGSSSSTMTPGGNTSSASGSGSERLQGERAASIPTGEAEFDRIGDRIATLVNDTDITVASKFERRHHVITTNPSLRQR